jgi:hypothetical protein
LGSRFFEAQRFGSGYAPFIVRMRKKQQQKQLTDWAKNMYFNLLSDAYKLKQLARDKKTHTHTHTQREKKKKHVK